MLQVQLSWFQGQCHTMSEAVNLPPESILQVAVETEEKIWSQGGITDEREASLHYDPSDVGVTMLK